MKYILCKKFECFFIRALTFSNPSRRIYKTLVKVGINAFGAKRIILLKKPLTSFSNSFVVISKILLVYRLIHVRVYNTESVYKVLKLKKNSIKLN